MKYKNIFGLLACLLTVTGCVSNLRNIDTNVICPVEYTFKASFDRTWSATQDAVLQLGTIDEIDKREGTIISGISKIGGNETRAANQELFAQIYKYSYSIRLTRENRGKQTRINTVVKLFYEQLAGLQKYKIRNDQVENYLRDKLYREICQRLFPAGNGPCSNGFTTATTGRQYSQTRKTSSRKIRRHPDAKVKRAQSLLRANGYAPGPADGLMGRKTRQALKRFQADNGLPATGAPDLQTLALLEEEPTTNQEDRQINKLDMATTIPSKPKKSALPQNSNRTKIITPAVPPQVTTKKITGQYVTNDTVDLLAEEDLYNSDILATIPIDTALRVLSSEGEYYKVRYRGKEGFVYKDFVQKQ